MLIGSSAQRATIHLLIIRILFCFRDYIGLMGTHPLLSLALYQKDKIPGINILHFQGIYENQSFNRKFV